MPRSRHPQFNAEKGPEQAAATELPEGSRDASAEVLAGESAEEETPWSPADLIDDPALWRLEFDTDTREKLELLLSRLPTGVDRLRVLRVLFNAHFDHRVLKRGQRGEEREAALRATERAVARLRRAGGDTADLEQALEHVRVTEVMLFGSLNERRGRPKAFWRDEAMAGLRRLGLTRERADELVEAAGLAGRPPSR